MPIYVKEHSSKTNEEELIEVEELFCSKCGTKIGYCKFGLSESLYCSKCIIEEDNSDRDYYIDDDFEDDNSNYSNFGNDCCKDYEYETFGCESDIIMDESR